MFYLGLGLLALPAQAIAQCDLTDATDLVDWEDLDKAPQFPGGGAELLKFLDLLHFPALGPDVPVIGKVTFSLVIEADGRVSEVCALDKKEHPWTLALLHHLEGLPRFLPAERGEQAVRTRFVLPVYIHPE